MRKYYFIICLLTLAACKQKEGTEASQAKAGDTTASEKQVGMPIPNTVMTEEYVKSIASYAYIWGWPMENIHNRFETFKNVPEPGYMGGIVPIAPPNRLCMLTDYIVPEERVVACPNQDVVYGFGVLDFSKDAVIVQVPDFGDRFWVYQVCDQRTDGFAEIGKMYSTKPGFYLLTGPGWDGKVPDGIAGRFECPTKLGVVIPRAFQSDDPADKQAIQPVIKEIMMYPLSEFDGKVKTKDWKAAKVYPADPNAGSAETKWVKPEVFFDILPEILKEVPPMPGEESWYAQMQGVLDAAAKDPKVKEWLKQTAMKSETYLITPLFRFINVGYPINDNWTTQKNGAQFGYDYLTRASCAKANIFVNKPNETKYFYQDLDQSGARLNGNNKYSVTFPKGQLPPVKGFWSLTLYNEHHFFSPNDLNRYSLGTKNKNLKYNDDGSLTLYVQSTAPDKSKITNWLPAPKADFSLYVRCYWPEEKVLTDTWQPPAVVKH